MLDKEKVTVRLVLSSLLAVGLAPATALAQAPATAEHVAVVQAEGEGTVIDDVGMLGVQAGAASLQLDVPQGVTIGEGEHWVASFNVPEDGTYVFKSVGDADAYADLYADEGLTDHLASGDDEDGSNFGIARQLTAGTTVYLRVGSYDDGASSFEVSVSISDVSLRVELVKAIMLRGVDYDYDGSSSWHSTIPASGDKLFVTRGDATTEYVFDSETDSFVNVDDENDVISEGDYAVDVDVVEQTATMTCLGITLDLGVTFIDEPLPTMPVLTGNYDDVLANGEWGTCPWEIRGDGTLLIMPGEGVPRESNDEFTVKTDEGTQTYYSIWTFFRDVGIRKIRAVSTGGRRPVAPADASGLFSSLSSVTSMDLSQLDVSQVEDMSGMFEDCSQLSELNLNEWDTSRVEDMSWMFLSCNSLKTIDAKGLVTSSVTSLHRMFDGCLSLKKVDTSKWDTSNVTAFGSLFNECSALESIDTTNWDTSSAQYLCGMFSGCSSLRSLDLTSFDTSNVVGGHPKIFDGMEEMYRGCTSLSSWKIGPKYDTSWDGAVPAATASNGKWWSSASGAWYTPEQISSGRILTADTYLSEERQTKPSPASISGASVTVAAQTYTGRAITPSLTVKLGLMTLRAGTDYTVSYKNNVNAGTATVTITGRGNYAGTKTATFKIAKDANGMSARGKSTKLKASKVRKKAQSLKAKKAYAVTGASGKLTYKLKSVTKKKFKKYFKVAKSGKITAKKGLPKGTYKLKVAVTAAGDANHEAATKTITVKVVVK